MLTAFRLPASAIPGFFVRLNLQAIVELVETTEQIDDGHQFEYGFIVQAQIPHRGSMNRDSVITAAHCLYQNLHHDPQPQPHHDQIAHYSSTLSQNAVTFTFQYMDSPVQVDRVAVGNDECGCIAWLLFLCIGAFTFPRIWIQGDEFKQV